MSSPSSPRPDDEFELDDWDSREAGLPPADVTKPAGPGRRKIVVLQPLPEEDLWRYREPAGASPRARALVLLKCLALIDLAVRNAKVAAAERKRVLTGEDMLRVALARLHELPIDHVAHAGFLAKFIAKIVGAKVDTQTIRKFQLDRRIERPNFLPEGLSVEDDERQARAVVKLIPIEDIPDADDPDFEDLLLDSYQSWGRNAIDQGPGKIAFDDERAVIEEVQAIPALGSVLFTKQGRFRSKLFRRATLLTVAACFALLGAILMAFAYRKKDDHDRATAFDPQLFRSPDLEVVRSTLKTYATAKDWNGLLALIRAPAEVESKMRAWYAVHPLQPLQDVQLRTANVEIIHEMPFILATVEPVPRGRRRAFLLQVAGDKQYKIDWEFAELHQSVEWGAFIERGSAEPTEMRCVLRPAKYFNWEFADDRKFDCWMLLDPREEGMSIYGYVEKDSEVGRTLVKLYEERLMRRVFPAFAAILKLAYPQNAQDPSQVRILEIVEPAAVRRFAAPNS